MSLSNVRVNNIRPLIPPAVLIEEYPSSPELGEFIRVSRQSTSDIIAGKDDRLICIVGPCSIHDPIAAIEYAVQLADIAKELKDDLFIVMRVYFEKPRTTVGWKGLINDVDLDGTNNINKGLRTARKLLIDVNRMGLPVGSELLDTISPQFISDLISWGAIGARTTESQLHRELASGMSFPIGFKNGSSGSVQIALDAMISSFNPHTFLGVSDQGLAAIVETRGNEDVHVILRGGNDGPNYSPVHVETASKKINEQLKKSNIERKAALIIDCSHGNSGKDHKKQPFVLGSVCSQVSAGNQNIIGVMVESFLVEGSQKLVVGPNAADNLTFGLSVTDKCVDWPTTEVMLRQLAAATLARRSVHAAPSSKL